jgi:hydrogenase/urease accessory protein HupE
MATRRTHIRIASFCAAILISIWSAAAPAHQINLSIVEFKIDEARNITTILTMEGTDLNVALNTELTIRGGIVNPHSLTAAQDRVIAYVLSKTKLFGKPEGSCTPGASTLEASFQSAILTIKWECSAVKSDVIYATTLFFEQSADAGQYALLGQLPNRTRILLSPGNNELAITGPPPGVLETARRFTISGIEHIFIGIDHIAFLAALLLWAWRMRSLIKIVTAFTVAHSITLTLAVLDLVSISSLVIEAAIAASIIYVAAENFFRQEVDRKWMATFFLGLVHGFGFAGALKDFGIPSDGIGLALASFNIGVEIGQIALVGIGFPLLLLSDNVLGRRTFSFEPGWERDKRLVYILSAVILLAGVYWLVERTLLAP